MELSAAQIERTMFLVQNLKPARPTRIVDIGANPLDKPPYSDLFNMGGCEVWGFEPQPEAFEKLKSNSRDNEHYLPYAIGDGTTKTLNIYHASGFTSLLTFNPQFRTNLGIFDTADSKLKTQIEIQTKRLDSLDDLPDFDLLKIDIQGGEVAVFKNGPQKISRAVAVITEVAAVPLYVDQPLLDDQMRALRSLGFDLHKFLFFKRIKRKSPATDILDRRKHSNQLVDGDAVFLRGIMSFASLNNQDLRHQVILADSVYHSYDFALQLLEELTRRQEISDDVADEYSRLLQLSMA